MSSTGSIGRVIDKGTDGLFIAALLMLLLALAIEPIREGTIFTAVATIVIAIGISAYLYFS